MQIGNKSRIRSRWRSRSQDALVIETILLICWHGVTPAGCQAVMLSHAAMSQTNMLPRCHAEMRASGHVVALAGPRPPEEVP